MSGFRPAPVEEAVAELQKRVSIYDMPPAPPSFRCEHCKDLGEIPDYRSGFTPVGGKGAWMLCPDCGGQDVLDRRFRRLMALSRLPEKLLERTLENFDPNRGKTADICASIAAAHERGVRFAGNTEGFLLFYGPSGTGKTHLMVGIAQVCIARGLAAVFVTVPDFLSHLRASYADDAEVSFDHLQQQFRECPVLLLDDLGTERLTEWAEEQLFTLINHRYNAGLPTVVSTNLNPDPFHPQHGDLHPRIWSRIAGDDSAVELRGEDKRLAAPDGWSNRRSPARETRPVSTWTEREPSR